MRALFVSDLHANLRLPLARVSEGSTSSDRLEDVIAIFGQMKGHAGKVGAEHIYILGDLFDAKHPDGATLVAVSRALRDLAQDGIQVHILPGNHDAVDRDGRLYTLQFYGELRIPGIHVLGHGDTEVMPGLIIHSVPWLPDARASKRIRGIAARLSSGDRHVLLFHQGVVGAIGDSGWLSTDGLEPEVFNEGFDLALTGHFHAPQRKPGYMYLGAPLHLRFSDPPNDPRGFWEVDLEAKKLKPIMVETRFPQFGTDELKLRDGDKVEDLVDIEESAGGLAYLRLVVRGPASAIDINRRQLLAWKEGAASLGLRSLKLDIQPDREARKRLKVEAGATLSVRDLIRQYAERCAPEGADARALAALGTRLLDEVEAQPSAH